VFAHISVSPGRAPSARASMACGCGAVRAAAGVTVTLLPGASVPFLREDLTTATARYMACVPPLRYRSRCDPFRVAAPENRCPAAIEPGWRLIRTLAQAMVKNVLVFGHRPAGVLATGTRSQALAASHILCGGQPVYFVTTP